MYCVPKWITGNGLLEATDGEGSVPYTIQKGVKGVRRDEWLWAKTTNRRSTHRKNVPLPLNSCLFIVSSHHHLVLKERMVAIEMVEIWIISRIPGRNSGKHILGLTSLTAFSSPLMTLNRFRSRSLSLFSARRCEYGSSSSRFPFSIESSSQSSVTIWHVLGRLSAAFTIQHPPISHPEPKTLQVASKLNQKEKHKNTYPTSPPF